MLSIPKINLPLFPTRSEEPAVEISADISLTKLEEIRQLSARKKQKALKRAIASARGRQMGRGEREAQIVSFVWGNAPEGNQGTIETVRENLKLTVAK